MDCSSSWIHHGYGANSSSWIHHGYGANSSSTGNRGFMCGYAAGCVESAAGLQCREEEQELLVSSQIQHDLNQISMHLSMDDEPVYGNGSPVDMQHSLVVDVDFLPSHHGAGSFPSSSSSSFPSASLSCSPESSPHLLTALTAGAGCLQYPEVSSHVPLAAPVVLPYVDDLSFEDLAAMATPEMSTSAFRRYPRHLSPRRRPKPGTACGQRMFKKAMLVLAKMHTAMRYRHQYSYQQASAEAAEPPSSGNQLQHMISERKRREKLNDSFHALKAVLPPGPKKDKTSILITAREYVSSLKFKLCELEEKNQALESRLARRAGSDEEDTEADEKVEIEITTAAAAEEEPRETCTVRIAVRPACSPTDVVLRTLQYLKDQVGHDVGLVAMSTSDGAPAGGSGPRRPSLTLQLKSASGAKWEEAVVKEAVTKAVAVRGDDRHGPWRRRPASALNEINSPKLPAHDQLGRRRARPRQETASPP